MCEIIVWVLALKFWSCLQRDNLIIFFRRTWVLWIKTFVSVHEKSSQIRLSHIVVVIAVVSYDYVMVYFTLGSRHLSCFQKWLLRKFQKPSRKTAAVEYALRKIEGFHKFSEQLFRRAPVYICFCMWST